MCKAGGYDAAEWIFWMDGRKKLGRENGLSIRFLIRVPGDTILCYGIVELAMVYNLRENWTINNEKGKKKLLIFQLFPWDFLIKKCTRKLLVLCKFLSFNSFLLPLLL